jgi:hypothetical protein
MLFIVATSCNQNNNSKRNDFKNKYLHLRSDTINTFSIGDTFQFITTENSCCETFFMHNKKPTTQLVHKGLFKLIYASSDIADSDCAGCSSYYTGFYKCVTSGIDTIIYVVIPHSQGFEISELIDDSGIDITTEDKLQALINEHSRKYIIRVVP